MSMWAASGWSAPDLWAELTGAQSAPSTEVVLGAAAVALLLVASGIWPRVRQLVTIAHEAGHALVALLAGRRLSGIRLHSDTSGVTVSRGRPTGPGMVFTALAGYPASSLLGLGAALLLEQSRITLLLWLGIVLLALTLVVIRNVYGVFAIVVIGLGVFAVSWFASAEIQAVFACVLVWFLLVGGIRPLFELQRSRRRRRERTSDVDQLAQLTRVPALVWVLLFGLFNLGCLVLGGYLLLPAELFTSSVLSTT